jgi:hypothetical protein
MIVHARRASAILYNLLRSRTDRRPFLIPANVCPVVPEGFTAASQAFQLVDLEEHSLEIDPQTCFDLLESQPGGFAGLLSARPYGSERDPSAFFASLKKIQSDLLIIDDKCLCRPDPDGEQISAMADVTLFSTGRAKYTDIGSGGFAHIRDTVPYSQLHGDSAQAWIGGGEPELQWDDYRQRVLSATVEADELKRSLNAIYAEMLPPEIQFPPQFQHWRFNIRVRESEELIRSIFDRGLFASRHYPALAPGFPIAEGLHASIVNLFNDRYFDRERAHAVAEVVLRHLSKRG